MVEKINFSTQADESLPVEEIEIKTVKKSPVKKIAFIFLGVLGFVLLFYILSALAAYFMAKPMIAKAKQSQDLAMEAYGSAKNQDLVSADSKIKELKTQLEDISTAYPKISYLKYIPFYSAYYHDGEKALAAVRSGIDAGVILLDTITPYADVLGFQGQGSFTGGTAEDRIVKIVQTLDKVTPQLDEIIGKINEMESNIDGINPSRYPKSIKGVAIRDQISMVKSSLSQVRQTLEETKPVIEVLPQVLGYPDKQKYLVLFQNDGELRPTGGFITAYSVFDVEAGKARSGNSDDIYSLDSKLGNKLEAPEVLAKYLNVQAYHLRDMNWSPDFQVSMEEFLAYYGNLSGVEKVDGIIAIDTKVLKALLDVLGPVDVPGYGHFTMENDPRCNIPQVICALEYIVDEPLPDIVANRKSTILGPMMQEIMFKSYGATKQQWPDLFNVFISALKEKHMLLYFKDEKRQQAAEAFGAAGRIKDITGDYLAVVDANLGGAKSNLYVTSEVEQKFEKTENGLEKTVTINYLHPEPMDNCNLERAGGLCLSGVLQDYFRVYVPKGAKLIEGLGSETEIESSEDLDKTVFSGFFKLRGGGGRAKIVLRYKLPEDLSSQSVFPLLIQKQAGTDEPMYTVIDSKQKQEIELLTDKQVQVEL